jgi:hypothetical protein
VLGQLLQQPFLMWVSSLKILLYKFAATPIKGLGGVWDEGMICGFGVGMQFFDRFTRTEQRVPV